MITVLVSFCAVLILLKIYFKLYGIVGSNQQKFTWSSDSSANASKWAVVTGASSGIGLAFSTQLARKGYNLMLISRNENKLSEAIKKIKADLKVKSHRQVEIRTLAVDFTRLDIYEAVANFVKAQENEIHVLVNNVGQCPPYPKLFTNESPADHDAMLHVNIFAATRMLQLILPSMVDREGGGRLVINVASIAARYLFPLSSIYAATKAYIGQLSECLALEYRNKGLTFATFYPSAVSTAMIHNAREDFFTVSAEKYVSSALDSIRTTSGVHWPGYYTHWLLEMVADGVALLTSREFVGTIIEHCSLGYQSLVRRMQTNKTDGLGNFNMWNALVQKDAKCE